MIGIVAGHGSLARGVDQPSETIELAIEGHVAHPGIITLTELKHLPVVTVTIDDPEHASVRRIYTGALLWTVVTQAGPIDAPGRKTRLQHTLLARGRDGYAVALASAETDPSFEGKQVIVAYSQDGTSLHDLRLVVPNDRKQGARCMIS